MAAENGLSDEETEWLIRKGEQWGIYSQNAVQAYKDAEKEAEIYQDQYMSMTHERDPTR